MRTRFAPDLIATPSVDDEEPRRSRIFSVMAAIALFIGILAAVGLEFELAIVMGCLAILLGVLGLVRIKKRKRKGKALSIVTIVFGAILAIIATAFSMFYGIEVCC